MYRHHNSQITTYDQTSFNLTVLAVLSIIPVLMVFAQLIIYHKVDWINVFSPIPAVLLVITMATMSSTEIGTKQIQVTIVKYSENSTTYVFEIITICAIAVWYISKIISYLVAKRCCLQNRAKKSNRNWAKLNERV